MGRKGVLPSQGGLLAPGFLMGRGKALKNAFSGIKIPPSPKIPLLG
jgi:hypothetical protein